MHIKKQQSSRTEEITVRVAATMEDYETAFRIAYEVYYSKGFTGFSDVGMRASSYQLQSSTLVLIGYLGDKPIATLSVYEGCEGVFPSSAGWSDEFQDIGQKYSCIMELGTLMVLPEYIRSGSSRICLTMFRTAWNYARFVKKADAFCAFVQAHHKRFYERILNFSAFGVAKNYEWNGLNIGNVVPLVMDLRSAESEFKDRFDRFGSSSRNIYRFFAIDDREKITNYIRQGLRLRDSLIWKMLAQRFSFLLFSKVA